MKALAYQGGWMDELNGEVFNHFHLSNCTMDGRVIKEMGVIGPHRVIDCWEMLLKRHQKLDNALLTKLASYYVEQTNWAALLSVEGLEGVYYLRSKPGSLPVLIWTPVQDGRALVITQRAERLWFYESCDVENYLQAIQHHRNVRR
jgi:hypothetical protein